MVKKKAVTMDLLEELREVLRSASAQVVDTHDEIDLNWMRAGKTLKGRRKMLLYIANSLDDDIQQIRMAQQMVREAIGGEDA